MITVANGDGTAYKKLLEIDKENDDAGFYMDIVNL